MLNILESFVASQGYTYRRMDGSTSVASRQPLISKFNQVRHLARAPRIYVFDVTPDVTSGQLLAPLPCNSVEVKRKFP